MRWSEVVLWTAWFVRWSSVAASLHSGRLVHEKTQDHGQLAGTRGVLRGLAHVEEAPIFPRRSEVSP